MGSSQTLGAGAGLSGRSDLNGEEAKNPPKRGQKGQKGVGRWEGGRMKVPGACCWLLGLVCLSQATAGEDLSHLPMEHRGGDILLRESKGPIAQAQRRPLGGFKRQAVQDDDVWPAKGSDADQPQIQDIQVQCEKTSIRVNIKFDRPFYGMVFSKGFYSDPNCIHLAAGTGTITASFEIFLNTCGMTSSGNTETYGQPNPAGSYVENTVIIQYDPLVQEVWDQARKLRCTWYDYYEKSVTFRPFQVDMINAVTANFLGDNLQCWMQIQVGKGPWSSEVSGIVKIGQTMTMVLGIKDDENKFDMLVRNCVAHDGKRAPIQLVDELGCVTRPKIMSSFQKIKNFGSSASVVSYAYFQAFKFPDSMNVHFQCVIQVCRYNCPDPVCGDSNPGVISTSTYTGPSPPSGYSANQRIDLNNRVYNVDPRNPGGPRPAGLIMDDATLDKLSAPKTDVKTGGRNLVGGPQVGGRRRGGPSPPAQRSPPRAPVFPKIPGLTKRLGDLLAGKAAVNREEGRSLNSRPVLKRLYKREADGQEMADIDMSGIIQVLSPGDVAFTLGAGNDSYIVSNSAEWDPNNICMSLTSLVGGLVMLLGVLVVASFVASFMHCQMRKKKTKKVPQ